MKIGFSTGALYQSVPSELGRIAAIRKIGCAVIELGFVKLADFTRIRLNDLTQDALASFEYVSFHAPMHEYKKDAATKHILKEIIKLNAKVGLDLVVVHPDNVVDFSVFNDLPFRVGFENMDNRKCSFKTPTELAAVLAENENFSAVLDLNHAYSNDPTMALAKGLYETAGPKVSQIHLSGCHGHHDPLFRTRQKEIIHAIQDQDVPIIIESILSPQDMRKEMSYIVKQMVMKGLD